MLIICHFQILSFVLSLFLSISLSIYLSILAKSWLNNILAEQMSGFFYWREVNLEGINQLVIGLNFLHITFWEILLWKPELNKKVAQ